MNISWVNLFVYYIYDVGRVLDCKSVCKSRIGPLLKCYIDLLPWFLRIVHLYGITERKKRNTNS